MAATVAETRDFFATAAQVIPLFALAVVAERRFGARQSDEGGRPSWMDSTDSMLFTVLAILFAGAAAIAEAAAFHGLAYRPTLADRRLVIGGLSVSGVSLFVDVTLQWLVRQHRRAGWCWQTYAVVGFGVVVCATACALAADAWFTAN